MTTKLLGAFPASVLVKKISKKDLAAQEAHAREDEQAAATADETISRLRTAAAEGRTDAMKQELLAAGAVKANEKLPKRIRVSLTWCKTCQDGRLALALANGHGKALQVTKLTEDPVPATFVSRILELPAT